MQSAPHGPTVLGRPSWALMIRIAFIDDHPAVLAGLRRLVAPAREMEVLAAASNEATLAQQLHGRRPDVLVLDYDVARGDALALCRRIKNRPVPLGVIIYSAYASPALALAARAAAADAMLDKTEPVTALLDAIRRVADGETVFPELTSEAYQAAVSRLDDADLPVLAMLLDGEPLHAIAETLRTDEREIAWRAERIVGHLRPRLTRAATTLTPNRRPRRLSA
jgi:DNA-binding NarL/FixJ family response regulator